MDFHRSLKRATTSMWIAHAFVSPINFVVAGRTWFWCQLRSTKMLQPLFCGLKRNETSLGKVFAMNFSPKYWENTFIRPAAFSRSILITSDVRKRGSLTPTSLKPQSLKVWSHSELLVKRNKFNLKICWVVGTCSFWSRTKPEDCRWTVITRPAIHLKMFCDVVCEFLSRRAMVLAWKPGQQKWRSSVGGGTFSFAKKSTKTGSQIIPLR